MKTESAASTPNTDQTDLDQELTEVARGIAAVTWDLKALNTTVIDLRGRVSYTDFIVVATGTSERHVQALARRVDQEMRESGRKTMGAEGLDTGRWALLDYGDIIVHIFHQDARSDYDLERMWSEAPRLELEGAPAELYGHFDGEAFDA
ncbi:ribosome silencing factor [Lujinxingia litoralis]|uniref:Ribosomal silencing factor RsfS n=1 Tax=Lujinxingia litoralis TaxID=2211119 RepID=A0A328CE86_9DELT|nr:ribosome silencing factor [Lujinxingia litoralis]RAL25449.1 ribosome silencing factor [Lujinxingia litoralis]